MALQFQFFLALSVEFPNGAAVTNVEVVAARTAIRVVNCMFGLTGELVRARFGGLWVESKRI